MTRPILRALLVGTSAVLLIPVPALWAQDGGGQNIPLTFGISQSFQSLTNPDFQSPSSGTTDLSITSLSIGSSSTTPTDAFTFDAGIGLLIQRLPDGSLDIAPNAPNVGLNYGRTTPSSALSLYASYAVIPLDQIRSIEDFITADGQIDLPSNPADLTSTGLEQDIRAGGSLELGRDALFGLTLTALGEQISYTETTDPALQDLNRAEVGATGRFNYSPQGSVSLGVSAEHQVTLVPGTVGAATTDVVRDQQNLTLGTSYDVSPVLTLSGFVSYEVVDQSNQAQTRNPRAQISANYTYKTGSLSIQVGDQDSALTWQQALATGAISATLSHGLDDSGDGTLDQLGFNYSQPINDVSGLSLAVFYSGDTGSSTSPDVASSVLVASYNRQVSKDWSMNVGANFRLRDPSGNDDLTNASSAGLFLTLSRDVNFLR